MRKLVEIVTDERASHVCGEAAHTLVIGQENRTPPEGKTWSSLMFCQQTVNRLPADFSAAQDVSYILTKEKVASRVLFKQQCTTKNF